MGWLQEKTGIKTPSILKKAEDKGRAAFTDLRRSELGQAAFPWLMDDKKRAAALLAAGGIGAAGMLGGAGAAAGGAASAPAWMGGAGATAAGAAGGGGAASLLGGLGGYGPALAGAAIGAIGNNYDSKKAREAAQAQANQANEGFNIQKPYLQDLYGRSQQFMDQGGTQVPGLDPYSLQAQRAGLDQAFVSDSRLNPAYSAVNRAMNPGADPAYGQAGSSALQALQRTQGFGLNQAGGQYNQGQGALQRLLNQQGGYEAALPGAIDTLQRAQTPGGGDPTVDVLRGGAGRSGQYLDQLNPSLQSMLSGQTNTAAYQPVLEGLRRSAKSNFTEQIIPGINDRFTASGTFGGGRYQKALGIAAGKTNEALLNAEAQLGAQAAEQALTDRRYGAGLSGQLSGQQAGQAAQAVGLGEGIRSNRAGEALNAAGQIGAGFGQARGAQLGALGLNEQIRSNLTGEAMGSAGQLGSLYQQGQNTALNAAGMVPGLQQASLLPYNVLNQMGDQNRSIAIDKANQPAQNLGFYSQMLQGNYASPKMGATPIYSSPLGGAVGGAMMGNQLYNMYQKNQQGGL